MACILQSGLLARRDTCGCRTARCRSRNASKLWNALARAWKSCEQKREDDGHDLRRAYRTTSTGSKPRSDLHETYQDHANHPDKPRTSGRFTLCPDTNRASCELNTIVIVSGYPAYLPNDLPVKLGRDMNLCLLSESRRGLLTLGVRERSMALLVLPADCMPPLYSTPRT